MFSRYILCILIASCVFVCSSCKPAAKPDKPTYRIGYMICNSEEETMARFLPLTAFLSDRIGVNFEAVAVDTLRFSKEIENLDFTHTNSLLYVMLNRFNGVEILAAEKRGELKDRSKGLVVSLKKSGITSIEQMKGKSMIFGPMLAPTAFMSQVYALQQKGFDVDEDLAYYNFHTGTFKHEKVIYSLLFEKFEIGAFPYYDFEIMADQGKINREDFNILAEGPLIPYCNFAVTQRVEDSLAQKFKNALLSIQENDTIEMNHEKIDILERAELQGFTDVTDADFDIVRAMAKATNMPPYQEY